MKLNFLYQITAASRTSQNPWLGGYRPQIPIFSALCPQLNLLIPPIPNKISGYATGEGWFFNPLSFSSVIPTPILYFHLSLISSWLRFGAHLNKFGLLPPVRENGASRLVGAWALYNLRCHILHIKYLIKTRHLYKFNTCLTFEYS